MYNIFSKDLEGMSKEVEKNLEGLKDTHEKFMDDHRQMMDILNRSLESIMIENEDRANTDAVMAQIDKDLGDLLNG